MIPTSSSSVSAPLTEGNIIFHVVVDFTNQSFSMDGPETNGIQLHYEVLKVARGLKNRFWEFDIRAGSPQQALADMQKYFPGHRFAGTWAETRANNSSHAN